MTMGIVEFLEARIAEDEAVAQDAGARALEWRSSNGSVSGGGKPYVDDWSEDEPLTQYDGEVTIVYDEGWPEDVEAAHIARYDPARVLQEVAAKRAIIAASKDTYAGPPWEDADIESGAADVWDGRQTSYREVLANLACAYSDHPDFNEEWRP